MAGAVTGPGAPAGEVRPGPDVSRRNPLVDGHFAHRKMLLPLLEKALFLALLDHCDAELSCHPGVETLAAEIGCSERAVQLTLPKLAARGLVVLKRELGKSTEYRLVVREVNDVRGERRAPPNDVHPTPERGAGVPPNVVRERGERRAPEGRQGRKPSEGSHLKDPRRSAPAVPKKGSTGGLFGEQEPEKLPSDHQRVVAAWVKAYGKNHGGAQPTTKGRAGKANFAALKELLASQGVDGAIAVIRAAYADESFERFGGTLQRLATNPDKYKVAPKAPPSFKPFPPDRAPRATPEEVRAIFEKHEARRNGDVVPPPAGLLEDLVAKLDAGEAEVFGPPVTGSEHADVFHPVAEIRALRHRIEELKALRQKVVLDEDDEDRGERIQNAERDIYVASERIKELDGTKDRERQAAQARRGEIEARIQANAARRAARSPGAEVFDGLPIDAEAPVPASSSLERPTEPPASTDVRKAQPRASVTGVGIDPGRAIGGAG